MCKLGIVNADDSHCGEIIKDCTCKLESFGIDKAADFTAKNISLYKDNSCLGIEYILQGGIDMKVKLGVPGKFNVYNSLAAISICSHLVKDKDVIAKAMLNSKCKGRLEPTRTLGHYSMYIDYAHNAMALENVLSTLREYNPSRLVCLFGCGGNRSKDRRYEMGEVSSKMADLTIVTSDNPRFEKPEDIIADILIGVNKADGEYVTIPDRREAIKYSIENAMPGDVIILAGKGHEDYQEIEGIKHHMDEREIVEDIIACMQM